MSGMGMSLYEWYGNESQYSHVHWVLISEFSKPQCVSTLHTHTLSHSHIIMLDFPVQFFGFLYS